MPASARPQDPATEGTADRVADAAEAVRAAVEGRLPAALDADGGLRVHVVNAPDAPAGVATDAKLEELRQSVIDVQDATVALGTAPLATHAQIGTLLGRWPVGLDADGGLPVHLTNPGEIAGGGGGGEVSLDAATLAALETINVGNWPATVASTQSGAWSVTVANPTDVSDLATEVTVAAILAELAGKLEPGQAVALDGATLAALETITVANPTDVSGLATQATLAALAAEDFATEVTLAAVNAKLPALASGRFPVNVDGTVALDAGSLAALETITVANPTDVSALATQATLAALNTKVPTLSGGDANGLDVDVTRLPALVAGTANIGTLGSGGAHSLGYVGARGIHFDDTSAVLAAAATFTGTGRDVTGNAPGGAMGNVNISGGIGAKEARFQAISDVGGTLYIEVSTDNATWRRIREVAATNTGTGGLYVAEIELRPARRYVRAVYVNGAAGQAHFSLTTMLLSA